MRHYCYICHTEREYRYIETIKNKRGAKVEVYQCCVCGVTRSVVVT